MKTFVCQLTQKRFFLSFLSLFIILGINSCKDEGGPSSQADLLFRTWLFQSSSGFTDQTDQFNFEQEFKDFELTIIKDPNSTTSGQGTYNYVAPNNPNDPSGSGTWNLDGTADNVIGLIFDPGTADEQYFTVIVLSSSQLHISFTDSSFGVIEMDFTAK